MQLVVSAAQMRALDRRMSDELAVSGRVLMELAGWAVTDVVRGLLGHAADEHVAVVCGPGNNGGDGYVVARMLLAAGVDVDCYSAVPRDAVGADAAAQRASFEALLGEPVTGLATADELATELEHLGRAAVVVDALFGVGLARELAGHLAEVVVAMGRARRCVAIDLPSGLDADTGKTLGVAVRADVTVATGPRKVAHVSSPGFATCGRVEVCDLGIPRDWVRGLAAIRVIEGDDVARWLPRSSLLDHKGTRGHVLVVGGAPEMRGAGRLAATAALRAGAGLVTLAGDGQVDAPDSVMTAGLGGGPLGDRLAGKAAIVIGPGLGRGAEARARVDEVLACGVPAVIDADALNLLAASDPGALGSARGPIVITPHPAEAGRLLGSDAAAVEADRIAAARALVGKTRATVVLKGARTIVAFDDAPRADVTCWIIAAGHPALATAGSGDVLSGAIAALLAQHLEPRHAAAAAVMAHGRAGEALAAVHGARGVVSSDLPLAIAEQISRLAVDTHRVSADS